MRASSSASHSSRSLGLLLGAALALSACSGDDSGGDTDSTTAATGSTSGGSTSGGSDTSGESTSTSGTSGTSGSSSDGSTTSAAGPPFADVFAVLMNNGCTSGYCHGAAAGGLALTDAKASYASLVDAPATMASCGQSVRVVPGDPDASVLWLRVRPAALDQGMPCGAKMPQGSMGLGDADAAVIEAWIAGGAAE